MGRNYSRNAVLRFLVVYVTAKPVHISTRKPKSTKLMNKQGMWDKDKCIAYIEISGISLTLRAD
jgi:hypothetical protein